MGGPITPRFIAELIPREYRKRLLLQNVIYKAVAQPEDEHMKVLYVIYTNYIDTGGDNKMDCIFCLGNILNNFKELLPILIELERDANLLDL